MLDFASYLGSRAKCTAKPPSRRWAGGPRTQRGPLYRLLRGSSPSSCKAPLAEEKKPVGTAVAVARGGVTCPAALVSADDKTYYSYAAQMSYAAYQAANP